jgi:hypothetical protein
MRSVVLALLLLTPPFFVFMGEVSDGSGPPLQEEQLQPARVLGGGNPLGWEWVEKDELAGYLWIREIEALADGTAFVAGIFAGGSASVYTHHLSNQGGFDVFIGKRNYDNKWLWLSRLGGTGDEFLHDMKFDNAQNLLLVGTTNSSQVQVTTNQQTTVTHTNLGVVDGWVAHVNSSTGDFSWFTGIGGTGVDNITGVSQLSNGDIALCGWTRSPTLSFNGTQYTTSGNEDMLVAWLSSSGSVTNGMVFGSTGSEMLHDCKVDNNGKTIAVGEFSSSTLVLNQTTISHGGGTGSDSVVIRVSPQTGVEWVRLPIASAHDRAMSVVVDSAGNIFVAGEHHYNGSGSRTITWGSIQLNQGADHSMIYVVKISNVGAIGWALQGYLYANSYGYYRQVIQPNLDLVGSHLALSVQSKGYSCLTFRSGSTSYGCFSASNSYVYWGSTVVGITNIGTLSTSNFRYASSTLVYDIDAVDNTTGGTDYMTSGWNNIARTTSGYTDSSDAPGGFLHRNQWQMSTNSIGPMSNAPLESYIGLTGPEDIIDIEPISATEHAVLIQSKTQSMRFGQHIVGGVEGNRLILAVIDNNGNWISADELTFGRSRVEYNSWQNDQQYNHNRMGANMDVAPNGTVWISLFWSDYLEIPNVIQKVSGNDFGVISWKQYVGWQSYTRLTFDKSSSYRFTNDIAVDGFGSVYAVGTCNGYLYADSTLIDTRSGWRTCVAKWNVSTSDWDTQYISAGYNSVPVPSGISGHPAGGAVVYDRGGYWYNGWGGGGTTYTDQYAGGLVYLSPFNNSAQFLGKPSALSGSQAVFSMDVNTNGDVVLGGWFDNSISYPNCCSVNTGGGRDGYLTYWNNTTSGWDWSISLGGSSNDMIQSLRFVGNDSIVVVGSKSGVISVGLTTLSSAGTGFVAVASTAGSWEWAQQPEGSTSLNAVSIVSNQSILVAGNLGYQTSNHVFGLDSLTTSDGTDLFVARMSPDSDSDGITNSRDNCPSMYNPSQADYDLDQTGDLCDADDDNDSVLDIADACPKGTLAWTSNTTSDYDNDGCQDATEDNDDDDDTVWDGTDLCPTGNLNWLSVSSPPSSRTDYDADGCQDVTEDADDDNDGVNDSVDVCPYGTLGWVSSPATDADGDGCVDIGEDADDDGDGIVDTLDECPTGALGWTSNATTDNDGDGCLDATEDLNDDNDDFLDIDDACPNGTVGWASGRFTDYDGDGCYDDGEDLDDDADGVLDVNDNCPMSIPGWRTNPTVDLDGDGCHDWNEDWDDDGDGVSDLTDRCPRTALGLNVDVAGCANGESPSSDGGSSVTNNYQNTTYVNNTYQNDSFYNSSYLNETNQYENNSYAYQNNSYANTTYENTTYENETFQNTTNMIGNSTQSEETSNQSGGEEVKLDSMESDTAMSFIELAVVALLLAIFIVQILMVSKPKQQPFAAQQQGIYQEMEADEFDKLKDEFDTKSQPVESKYDQEASTKVVVEDREAAVQEGNDFAEDSAHLEDPHPTEESLAGAVAETALESDGVAKPTPSLESPTSPPSEERTGTVDENGYEWIEHPIGSGQNFYRIQGQSTAWVLWE